MDTQPPSVFFSIPGDIYEDINKASQDTQRKINEISQKILSYQDIFSLRKYVTTQIDTSEIFMQILSYLLQFFAFVVDLILIPLQWIFYFFFTRSMIQNLEKEKEELVNTLQDNSDSILYASSIDSTSSSTNTPATPPKIPILFIPPPSPQVIHFSPPPSKSQVKTSSSTALLVDESLTQKLMESVLIKHKLFRSTSSGTDVISNPELLDNHIKELYFQLKQEFNSLEKNYLLAHLLVFFYKHYFSTHPECPKLEATDFLSVTKITEKLTQCYEVFRAYLSNFELFKDHQNVFDIIEQKKYKKSFPNIPEEMVKLATSLSLLIQGKWPSNKASIVNYSFNPLKNSGFTFQVNISHSTNEALVTNESSNNYLHQFAFEFNFRVLYDQRKVEVGSPQLMLPIFDFNNFTEI